MSEWAGRRENCESVGESARLLVNLNVIVIFMPAALVHFLIKCVPPLLPWDFCTSRTFLA